jgi:putative hemolysin
LNQSMRVIASEILIIVLLVLANGVFAMAEIAIVSCRKNRLRKLSEQGDTRAQAALELAESPNRFLSTVQVGITLVGILAGTFGGATIAREIAKALQEVPPLARYGDAVGIGIVVLGITLLSVVLGELVPKRLALNNPLGVALALARPVRRLSDLTAPVVRLLSALTDAVLKLFGFQPKSEPAVTEDEVRSLVEQGHQAGVFFQAEKELVEHALALDRKCVGDLMTQRAQVVWLNVTDANEVNWRKIVASGHTYFPVYEGQRDHVLGVVSLKALWANLALAHSANLRDLLTEPLFVPANMTALKLLETFKQSRKHLALVPDEFGTVQGLVTLVDVFEEIVGDIPSFDEPPQARVVRREDGSWLVDASLELDELKQLLGVKQTPGEENQSYETLSGFILHQMQRIPREGDHFEWGGFRFEIADVDRHRLDKILIQPLKRAESSAPAAERSRAPKP